MAATVSVPTAISSSANNVAVKFSLSIQRYAAPILVDEVLYVIYVCGHQQGPLP